MSDITKLSGVGSGDGLNKNLDLTTNTPVVLSIKIGGGAENTELTKAILDNLISHRLASSGVHGITGNVVGTTDTQTLSAKTLTSPILNTAVSGTAVLDDDTMATASNTTLATSESIKAYVDANAGGASAITITNQADADALSNTADTDIIVTGTSTITFSVTFDRCNISTNDQSVTLQFNSTVRRCSITGGANCTVNAYTIIEDSLISVYRVNANSSTTIRDSRVHVDYLTMTAACKFYDSDFNTKFFEPNAPSTVNFEFFECFLNISSIIQTNRGKARFDGSIVNIGTWNLSGNGYYDFLNGSNISIGSITSNASAQVFITIWTNSKVYIGIVNDSDLSPTTTSYIKANTSGGGFLHVGRLAVSTDFVGNTLLEPDINIIFQDGVQKTINTDLLGLTTSAFADYVMDDNLSPTSRTFDFSDETLYNNMDTRNLNKLITVDQPSYLPETLTVSELSFRLQRWGGSTPWVGNIRAVIYPDNNGTPDYSNPDFEGSWVALSTVAPGSSPGSVYGFSISDVEVSSTSWVGYEVDTAYYNAYVAGNYWFQGKAFTESGSEIKQSAADGSNVTTHSNQALMHKIVGVDAGVASTHTTIPSAKAVKNYVDAKVKHILLDIGDETTDLTTGTAKKTFRMPCACTLTDIRASVNTAPVGADLQIDINEGGVSVLSTVLSIDDGEKTSTTAATPLVISDSAIADDAEITIDIDQVGSTTAGKGLKLILYYTE